MARKSVVANSVCASVVMVQHESPKTSLLVVLTPALDDLRADSGVPVSIYCALSRRGTVAKCQVFSKTETTTAFQCSHDLLNLSIKSNQNGTCMAQILVHALCNTAHTHARMHAQQLQVDDFQKMVIYFHQ